PLLYIRAQPIVELLTKAQLADEQANDKQIQRVHTALTDPERADRTESHKFLKNARDKYTIQDGIVYYIDPAAPDRGRRFDKLRIYVPGHLHHTFLHANHDHKQAGHRGVHKTLAR